MPLKATKDLNNIFSLCNSETLPQKETQLIALAAQLVRNDREGSRESYARAKGAGASIEETLCAACASACTRGDRAHDTLSALLEKPARSAFYRVERQALNKKLFHLVSLAACLADSCECAAGHIVEARRAGASEAELARAACITACVAGRGNHWRYARALQCAQGKKSCVC